MLVIGCLVLAANVAVELDPEHDVRLARCQRRKERK